MIEMKLTWNKEYCILKPTKTSIKLIACGLIIYDDSKSTDPDTKSIEPNIAIKSPKLISLHI